MADDLIVIEQRDGGGKQVKVTRTHWDRYSSVREYFRPVAEKKAASAVTKPPTGDKTKEK